MRSKAPVVMLESFAALAPRDKAKENGLSKIVKSELSNLLSEAKAQGKAVVFMCGGDNCYKLAKKVYLQPPFTDHGLRLGFLRWRESATEPWARERSWGDRVIVGLQLP